MNLIPCIFFKKLGRIDNEVIPSNIHLSNFTGEVTKAKGLFIADLIVGSFCVVEVDGSYHLLPGRNWIHGNQCVPSTLHQMLAFWNGDNVMLKQILKCM